MSRPGAGAQPEDIRVFGNASDQGRLDEGQEDGRDGACDILNCPNGWTSVQPLGQFCLNGLR